MSFFTPDLFLRPGLLIGAALAVIPILLHLLMRSKPKKLLFPALRLIQNRQKRNVRRLRLRHWWLLFLRILIILFLVIAIARPSLPAANYSLTWVETATFLGIVVLAVGVYFGLMRRWRKDRLPNHQLNYRRSVLRSGTGVAVALLALLFVFWPYKNRIAAEIDAPAADLREDLPVAAVFVFDTSASMNYRYEGQTRLEQGRDIATEYAKQLPERSRIAVGATTSQESPLFFRDLSSLGNSLEDLKTSAVTVALDQRIRDALRSQEQDIALTLEEQSELSEENRQDRFLREIYVFTDFSREAWNPAASELLKREMERLKTINVYLVDLSIDDPRNVQIDAVKLSSQSIPVGTPLSVDVTVSGMGPVASEQGIEVQAPNAAGKLITQKRTVKLSPGETSEESFFLFDLQQPFAQGTIRLTGDDPLDVDNIRYFTVGTPPPAPKPRVLIVTGEAGEGRFLKEPLAPTAFEELGQAPYVVDQKTSAWMENHLEDLGSYSVICLVNVPAPTQAAWKQLGEFVSNGGGLGVFLGSGAIQAAAYNSAAAQQLIPAKFKTPRVFDIPETLQINSKDHGGHPVFERMCRVQDGLQLADRPVLNCWYVDPARDATVTVWYSRMNGLPPTPAFVERSFGQGIVMMLTTDVTLHEDRRQNWSGLAVPTLSFMLFAQDFAKTLSPELMAYLDRQGRMKFNFEAGQDATVLLDPEKQVENFLLRTPDGSQTSQTVPVGESQFTVNNTNVPGHYRLLDADKDSDYAVGLSVNVPAEESDLTKMTPEELADFFGEDRYRVTRDLEELERIVNLGRLGQELFPQILMLVILVFCAEHLVSNRFYEADQRPEAAGLATS